MKTMKSKKNKKNKSQRAQQSFTERIAKAAGGFKERAKSMNSEEKAEQVQQPEQPETQQAQPEGGETEVDVKALQAELSTPVLRLYRSADPIGAELGGALKNVIAIAAGVVIGAGLGDSARAALMTRGYAEMLRFALSRGARAETLAGLSGFGDLVLTCTSDHSRNFRYGRALGAGEPFDTTTTVEGAATARAVAGLAVPAGVRGRLGRRSATRGFCRSCTPLHLDFHRVPELPGRAGGFLAGGQRHGRPARRLALLP